MQLDHRIVEFRHVSQVIFVRPGKCAGVDLEYHKAHINQHDSQKGKRQKVYTKADQARESPQDAGTGDPVKQGSGIKKDLQSTVL